MARRARGEGEDRAAHRAAAPAPAQATVRHYCQGIGDCHLLRFPNEAGGEFRMLIDCGVHSSVTGGGDTIAEIVADIAAAAPRIDVLVVTHEHWDHVSGFLAEAERFGRLEIGEVWMAWSEDPGDALAGRLDKYRGQALATLQQASRGLDRASGLGPHLAAVRQGLQAVLGFHFGAKGERVRAARDAAAGLGPPRYLAPGGAPITLPGLPNLRIYVLGPPRDPDLLDIREREGEMYGLAGSGGWPLARALACAFAAAGDAPGEIVDEAAPFDPTIGRPLSTVLAQRGRRGLKGADAGIVGFVDAHYAGPDREERDAALADQSWRRIDHDWLGAGADLALQLDSRTNNTSLVLAFELVDSGRVLLFPGDAQVGNWLSWQDLRWTVGEATVTGPALLARTVYLKVAHHGSHNATLRAKGLELMTSPDLAAFIPTNAADARKVGWGQMPFADIVEALHRQGGGRVIRADDPWIATGTVGAGFTPPSGSIRALRHQPGLWVELDIA